MILKNRTSGGFTLVELVVVAFIIALITGIVLNNFGTSRAKARDAKRISDIGHLQLALELYFDRCNSYPRATATTPPAVDPTSTCQTSLGTTITLVPDFISRVPLPPPNVPTDQVYWYKVNANKTDYVIRTKLEQPSEVIRDSVPDNIGGMECTTNPAQLVYCAGPR